MSQFEAASAAYKKATETLTNGDGTLGDGWEMLAKAGTFAVYKKVNGTTEEWAVYGTLPGVDSKTLHDGEFIADCCKTVASNTHQKVYVDVGYRKEWDVYLKSYKACPTSATSSSPPAATGKYSLAGLLKKFGPASKKEEPGPPKLGSDGKMGPVATTWEIGSEGALKQYCLEYESKCLVSWQRKLRISCIDGHRGTAADCVTHFPKVSTRMVGINTLS